MFLVLVPDGQLATVDWSRLVGRRPAARKCSPKCLFPPLFFGQRLPLFGEASGKWHKVAHRSLVQRLGGAGIDARVLQILGSKAMEKPMELQGHS